MSKKAQSASNRLTNLSVTIYPGYALVQGTYQVRLSKGCNKFQLEGLPTHYDPSSLYVDSFKGPGEVTLGPTSYRAANLNPGSVLSKSVNTKVTLRYGGAQEDEQQEVRGTLLSVAGTTALLRMKGGDIREVRNVVGFTYDQLPEGLSNAPSLCVTAQASKKGDYEVTFMYKALGVSWSADYKWIYDEEKSLVTWDGSVFVSNGSGASFPDANLKVVAGDAGAEGAGFENARAGFSPKMAAASFSADSVVSRGVRQADSESLGQVKIFTVPGAISVEEGESQKVPFFVANGVPVKRENRVKAQHMWHARGSDKFEQDVRTVLIFSNDKEAHLGTPLPSGAVAVMQRDSSGTLLKSGGGYMGDVAVGEKVNLETGTDFDLKATRIVEEVTEREEKLAEEPAAEGETKKSKREKRRKVHYTRRCKVELFNAKPYPVEFVVEEHMSEDCCFEGEHSLTKVSANAYETKVVVDAGKKAAVHYTVRQTVVQHD